LVVTGAEYVVLCFRLGLADESALRRFAAAVMPRLDAAGSDRCVVARVLPDGAAARRGGAIMLFRERRYRVAPGRLAAFNTFFLHYLLPVQVRHGATLVGCWQTDDGAAVVTLWAYRDQVAYHAVEAAVRADPDAAAAQRHRRAHLDPLVLGTEERFLTSTVPLALTALAHLATDTDSADGPGHGGTP